MCEQEKETYPEFRAQIRNIVDAAFLEGLVEYTDANWVDREQVIRAAVDLFTVAKEELSRQEILQPNVTIDFEKEDTRFALFSVEIAGGGPRTKFSLELHEANEAQSRIVRQVAIAQRLSYDPTVYAETHYHKTILVNSMIEEQLLELLQDVADKMSLSEAPE